MSKQQHSASLQIVEDNQDIIEISQNSFQIEIQQTNQFLHHQKNDDTFQLSLDQNSLSFQIEELKEQSNCKKVVKDNKLMPQIKVQNCFFLNEQKQDKKPLPIVQQQRKRKRRQIFQKYKQKTTQNLLASPQLQPVSTDLMNTFDEIFRIKSPQKTFQKQQKLKKQISLPQSNSVTGFKKKQSVMGMSQTSFDYMPITFTSHNQKIPQTQPVGFGFKVQNKNSISQFQIPSDVSDPKAVDTESNIMIGSTNSFIIDTEVNKISMIYPQQEEVSRDSADLQTFLKSELFKDDILDNTIRRTDTSYKSIQVSMVNPSIMISDHNETVVNKNFNLQQRFGSPNIKIEPNFNKVQKQQQTVKNVQQKPVEVFQTISIPQQKIVKEKVLSYPQHRIPAYLRQIRRRNTTYPNFTKKQKSQNFYQQQNIAFKELLMQFKKSLTFLMQINGAAYERFTVLTSLEKVLLNSLTLENFLNSGWQIIYTFKQQDLLKPQQNFLKRNYEYEKVKGALNNYLYIVSYYQKCNLNLQDEKAQRKYLEIRGKFWQIEKNIKMIGEDIYLLSIIQIFPQHYYEYLDILKKPFFKCKSQSQLKHFTKILAKFYNLRQSGDLLSMSQIGRCVKTKLQKMIQKVFIV